MKTLLCSNLFLSLFSCIKPPEETSNEVLVTVINECGAHLYIYSGTHLYLTDIFDCKYVRFLPIQIAPDTYKVVAEGEGGRKKEMMFTKGCWAQNLIITF